MLAIGLGKCEGAAQHHRWGIRGLREMMPDSCRLILDKTRFIGGLAVQFNLSTSLRLIAVCPCMILMPGPHVLNGVMDLVDARINEIPLLRKDFIVDEYQIAQAKSIGADVILLIAACLTPREVKRLAAFARNLDLEVLLELHQEEEVEHICDEAELIGINNRDLKNFDVNIEQSLRMAEKIPGNKIKIAESGINSLDDILLFKENGFKGFLIGELFMKQLDPGKAFESLQNSLMVALKL